ncbi:glycosyl hydrolase family 28 protein [Puniceicoccus vermicola]|uniref:Uncharacterized protein n=1 Tax=Puniceicoccus vermicola TaxID=388746 RepID=A0A7X1E551_9BACT|nr:glycosyl hydrolase family 28 protein [Puniceicoccus vermicola]MBC2602796.1 hypothetical protein [Puniceicoccus vermicola]
MIQTFTHPRSCRFSTDFHLEVNGLPVEVLRTDAADFALFVYDATQGVAEVVVTVLDGGGDTPVIRPLRVGIRAEVQEDQKVSLTIQAAKKLSMEIPGRRPLYIWANAPEENPPQEGDPDVLFFKGGHSYDVGCLNMESGQTLYIEGGAVFKGRISTQGKSEVTIRGFGIFDGSYYEGEDVPSIFFERCKHVLIRDITMIYPSGWMIVPGACEHVEICNVKQIGEIMCTDGIDVVGSKYVHIHDCFLRNNDDCVVVKAFNMKRPCPDLCADLRVCPDEILVENCTLVNDHSGNAMEIGHELSVERVSNVTFRNIDVISVHGQGAVFSLHNNDRAIIENVLFEDIRIEHCWDKFIDFRISKSRFSSDDERGHIRNVTLRNINWWRPSHNEGYTISIMGGWDAEHLIENVTFENVCINGVPIQHIDELEITMRYSEGITLLESASAVLVQ